MIDRVQAHCYLLALTLFTGSAGIVSADTIKIPLSGIGSVPSSAELAVSPVIMELGDVEIGSQKSQEFSITYSGDTSEGLAEIYSVEVNGEDAFDFTNNYAGYTSLENGQSVNFSVTFSPVTLGQKKAFLRIEHGGGNSPHIVLLTGKAIDIPTSELKLSSSTLDFGNVDVDTNKTVQFKLTNGGGNNYPAVNVYNVILSGEAANSFTTDFSNVLTINPGQSVDVKVTLNSSVAGNKTATVSIEHDGSNPNLKADLTAKIVVPEEPDNNNGPATEPSFLYTKLKNASPSKPTSLDFGPNGNLYVSGRDGEIYEYEVTRSGKNNYTTTKTAKISLVENIKNHDDDGTVNNGVTGRLVTGLLAAGTAGTPVLYVTSADPRMGAGPSGKDLDLDTNSVIVSKLTKNGNNWSKKDLVRGLPRSEENHQGNGMQLSKDGKTLYVSMGGHTNMGVPSNNFAKLPEYALSAAVIEINLQQIGNNTYDLPTLDDEDRPGANDQNDPFGGNNGKNMAILENNGPVEIYSPGFRNAYDLVLTDDGRMYTVDNGPNSGWGGEVAGNCLNTYKDGGSTHGDGLHYISGKGYYGGHPNPTRGSKNNKFNDSNPQSPIEGAANAKECTFKKPGNGDGALHVFNSSTNGMDEYTASNFGGAMKGDLLAASFNKSVYRIQLNNNGNKLTGLDQMFKNLGTPLDVTALGDTQVFPGTVWIADYAQNAIHIYEPEDY
ncbi:MAG: choice-of-anchor D domain-containing protein [Pseudomonadota bacterium]